MGWRLEDWRPITGLHWTFYLEHAFAPRCSAYTYGMSNICIVQYVCVCVCVCVCMPYLAASVHYLITRFTQTLRTKTAPSKIGRDEGKMLYSVQNCTLYMYPTRQFKPRAYGSLSHRSIVPIYSGGDNTLGDKL